MTIERRKTPGEAWETVSADTGGDFPPSQWIIGAHGELKITPDSGGGDAVKELILKEPAAYDDWAPFSIQQAGSEDFYYQFTKNQFDFDQPDGTPIISANSQRIVLGPGLPFVIRSGTADPSAGGGVEETAPAFYVRDNSGVTEIWLKTGAADTDWSKL